MRCMGAFILLFFFFVFMLEVFMGHMWSIRGVFMGYTYVSGMCRVCIGYVSGKYWSILGKSGKIKARSVARRGNGEV